MLSKTNNTKEHYLNNSAEKDVLNLPNSFYLNGFSR